MLDAPETSRCNRSFLRAFWAVNWGFGKSHAGGGCEGAHEAADERGHCESHEEDEDAEDEITGCEGWQIGNCLLL